MILTVGNIKGGVGKSTLACSIAAALCIQKPKPSVLLIDGDKQGSAALFETARTEALGDAGFSAVRAVGVEVRNQVRTMADKFDHIIIDAGGQDNPSLRTGLVASDAVLTPVAPRSFDAWALEDMAELIDEAQSVNERLKAFAVVNMGYPGGSDNEEALELIREYPVFQVIETPIVYRKAWSVATGSGLCPLEQPRKDQKAIFEFQAVLDTIFK